jgi:hypothetical protein
LINVEDGGSGALGWVRVLLDTLTTQLHGVVFTTGLASTYILMTGARLRHTYEDVTIEAKAFLDC